MTSLWIDLITSKLSTYRLVPNRKALLFIVISVMAGCQSTDQTQSSLFEDLGGLMMIERFADNFIEEIGYNRAIVHHFENTDLEQFRNSFIEHMCFIADGPCVYAGQALDDAHKNMNITEAEFNSTVDSMVKAMKRTGWKVQIRNRLLERFSVFRDEVLYR